MKIGIAIDPWKLDIFERHLKEAGYTNYEVHEGDQITSIIVHADYAHKLQPIIEAAQREAAEKD